MTPHPSKVYYKDGDTMNISDIDGDGQYYFLYKKSDYTEFSLNKGIKTNIELDNISMYLYFGAKGDGADIIYETTIDGETYVALGKGMA